MSEPDISSFLQEAGWADASVTSMGADAGLRRYCDLKKPDKQHGLLMDMSRAGYEASLDDYILIGEWLKENGINTPNIHHVELNTGLAVIEHMGTKSFGDALREGEDQKKIYGLATDVLFQISQRLTENKLNLGHYKDSKVWQRLAQFADYYVPAASNVPKSDALRQEFISVINSIEKELPAPVLGFCHADYHLENLIWRKDIPSGYGLIDFQDAFWGPLCYDLLNLLEDARVSVPEDIKQSAKEHYCQGMSAQERESFDAWYVFMASHFHCRVIGLFIMLYQERGMDDYLQHIPRLQNYIKGHLKNPIMAPLKKFIDKHKVSLDKKITSQEL